MKRGPVGAILVLRWPRHHIFVKRVYREHGRAANRTRWATVNLHGCLQCCADHGTIGAVAATSQYFLKCAGPVGAASKTCWGAVLAFGVLWYRGGHRPLHHISQSVRGLLGAPSRTCWGSSAMAAMAPYFLKSAGPGESHSSSINNSHHHNHNNW